MDALVSQYSRPAFEDEGYSQNEQQQLSEVTPSLSLKFALPPIAQVQLFIVFPYSYLC
jgi:20S proteasome subunit beta 5